MPEFIRYEGDPAGQLRRLARDLKVAGEVGLRKELYRGLQVAARPLIEEAKASAADTLPHGGGRGTRGYSKATGQKIKKLRTKGRVHRGGGRMTRVQSLAQRVVGARYSVKSTTGKNPSVVLRATDQKGRSANLDKLDGGTARHPTFGHKPWVDQPVKAGWWSRPMEASTPAIYREVVAAINRVADKFYT